MSANPKLFELRMEYPQAFTEITLRDLFAMAALAGTTDRFQEVTVRHNSDDLSSWAYQIADAMLAERARR